MNDLTKAFIAHTDRDTPPPPRYASSQDAEDVSGVQLTVLHSSIIQDWDLLQTQTGLTGPQGRAGPHVPQLVATPFLLLQQNRTRTLPEPLFKHSVSRNLIDRHVGGACEHRPGLGDLLLKLLRQAGTL